jgi:hypothetical protein
MAFINKLPVKMKNVGKILQREKLPVLKVPVIISKRVSNPKVFFPSPLFYNDPSYQHKKPLI